MPFGDISRRQFLRLTRKGAGIVTLVGTYKFFQTLIGVHSSHAFECNEDCAIYDGNNAGAPGMTIFHPANQDIVYDWFTYVPKSIKKENKNYILVYSTGGLSDYDQNTEAIMSVALFLQQRAEMHKFILLLPSIPNTSVEPYIYTIAVSEQVFYDTTDEFRKRPDLKVNQMIDSLTDDLTKDGYTVHDKAFFEGFSAGGMFVQRYTLLHPERVQAVGGGQCGGGLTLPAKKYVNPISNWNGFTMDWAVGVNNLASLVGGELNFYRYKQVPHLIYIGDQDINNSHLEMPSEGFWTEDQFNFCHEVFGDTDPIRLEKQCSFMDDLGCNFTFNLYPGYDHGIMPWATPEIYDDVFAFHESHKEKDDKKRGHKSLPFLPTLLLE